MSEALGPILATGRTAEVHAWADGQVLKLIRPEFGAAQADEEALAARIAADSGIGAPAFGGVVRIGERTGLIYERIDGEPMVDALAARPWTVLRLAARLARLHAAMHAAQAPGLPDTHAVLREAIGSAGVEGGIREAALRRLDALPPGSALLHGDLHPANVIISGSGPRVIDWIQATRGAPAADVARTLFLLRDSGLQPSLPVRQWALITVIRRTFASAYLRAYRRARPIDGAEVRAWRLPVLVARRAEGIAHERARLDRLIAGERAGNHGR